LKHNIITFVVLTILVLSGVVFWETEFFWFVIGAIILIYLAFTAYGSSQIQANYFINSINRGKKKSVVLTFDDGPDPEFTPRILDILKEKNVKATFFVIGKKAAQYPDIVKRMDEEGHVIANHSYSHHNLIALFSGNRLGKDLAKCNDIVQQTIGKTPLFFRPPFGVTTPRYGKAIRNNGLSSIGWSLRTLDTRAKTKYEVIDSVISKLKKGDIILLHDRLEVTTDALPDLIEHITSRKLTIEPLPIAINKNAYAES
jgi:peptidoglycan/xylan/chitin deacetylase (PgdA/CDA1 family)